MINTHRLLLLVLALAGFACTSSVKGPESNPIDGKLDSFYVPTEHGEIQLGVEAHAYLGEDEDGVVQDFHAFDFSLTGTAEVTLETLSEPIVDLDTVIYLYQQQEDGDWGSYIGVDDDGGFEYLSLLKGELDAGMYRVLVKGYNQNQHGPFTLYSTCEGAGCEASLKAQFEEAADGAVYISEADYEAEFLEGPVVRDGEINAALIEEAFGERIRELTAENSFSEEYDLFYDTDSDDLLDDLADLDGLDPEDDDYYYDSAVAFGKIKDLFDANLGERASFTVGPADEDGGLAQDQGFYVRMVVGRTAEGQLVGFLVGVVWT